MQSWSPLLRRRSLNPRPQNRPSHPRLSPISRKTKKNQSSSSSSSPSSSSSEDEDVLPAEQSVRRSDKCQNSSACTCRDCNPSGLSPAFASTRDRASSVDSTASNVGNQRRASSRDKRSPGEPLRLTYTTPKRPFSQVETEEDEFGERLTVVTSQRNIQNLADSPDVPRTKKGKRNEKNQPAKKTPAREPQDSEAANDSGEPPNWNDERCYFVFFYLIEKTLF